MVNANRWAEFFCYQAESTVRSAVVNANGLAAPLDWSLNKGKR